MAKFKKQIVVEIEVDALDERDANRRAQLAADKVPVTLIKGGFQSVIPGDVSARLADDAPAVSRSIEPQRRSVLAELLEAMEEDNHPVAPVESLNMYQAIETNAVSYSNTLTTHSTAPEPLPVVKTPVELAASDLYAACEKVAESCAIVLRSLPLPTALADHLRLVEKICRAALAKAQPAETAEKTG